VSCFDVICPDDIAACLCGIVASMSSNGASGVTVGVGPAQRTVAKAAPAITTPT
jgi:hypothetical protein